MTVSRLTCPNCSKVLRPAKPLPAGKKVKCPECGTIFTTGAEPADEAQRPGKKAAAGKPAKKQAEDEEAGTYAVIKDEKDDEDEEAKPKISYAPDLSIKDLRGPAVELLVPPSNKLTLVGYIGFFGWLALLVMLLVPRIFPISYSSGPAKKILSIGPGLSQINPPPGFGPGGVTQAKKLDQDTEKGSIYEIYKYDLMDWCYQELWVFLLMIFLLVLLMGYSGCIVYGAIQMQTLESRPWGMAGAIMAMLPLNVGGVQVIVAIVLHLGLGAIMDDVDYIEHMTSLFVSALWLGSLAVGIWCLVTLNKQEVVDGFEYVAE